MPYALNGQIHADDELRISWRDPFFETGLGVYETLRTLDGEPMFLDRHADRLLGGAATLDLDVTLDREGLRQDIRDLVKLLPSSDARVKICLLVAAAGVDVLVTAEAAPTFVPCTEPRSAVLTNSPFAAGCDLPRTKLWNRMPYALARRSAESRGFDDAVFLSPDGHLTETTRANFFFVREGELCTPELEEGILPGVTRAVVIETARAAGIAVLEGEFPVQALDSASEVFLTGSYSGIQPVSRIEKRQYLPLPGPMTAQVIALYERAARDSIC